MMQWVNDPACLCGDSGSIPRPVCCGSCGVGCRSHLDSWPRNFHMSRSLPKKKKKGWVLGTAEWEAPSLSWTDEEGLTAKVACRGRENKLQEYLGEEQHGQQAWKLSSLSSALPELHVISGPLATILITDSGPEGWLGAPRMMLLLELVK